MKRISWIVLLCICLVFGFIFLDNFFFHLVFKNNISNGSFNKKNTFSENVQYKDNVKPGSCLILEEKYCQQGTLIYDDNKNIVGIFYKTESNASLFSPDNNNYSFTKLKNNEKTSNLMIIGDNNFDDGVENDRLWYEISFSGILLDNIEDDGIFEKGDIFGYTFLENNQSSTGIFLTVKKVSFNKTGDFVSDVDENYLKKFISDE